MPFGADPLSQWLIIWGLLALSMIVTIVGIAMLDPTDTLAPTNG
ncbi:MAG: hypothetical protein ACRECH_17695 [Nitrososphaerales archaeon]